MSEEQILSAGIDIGTSTTQLIFSKMMIKNIAGFGRVPQTEIVSKEIIYRSNIYFTPLLSQEVIDGEKVNEIIKTEYARAGIKPEDLASGAVIITGESSRKKNARQVVDALSKIAGDFVVATAGPDLESILAGKGAGAAEISKKTEKVVANLDIGGGTTNICYFKDGEVYDTACLDIGGRLIKIEGDKVVYIAPKILELIDKYGIDIRFGGSVSKTAIVQLTDRMADILAQAVGLKKKTEDLDFLKTNRLIEVEDEVEVLTFSGGVAACMDKDYSDFEFQDVGVLLAKSIEKNKEFQKIRVEQAIETMRATVIGAGNYSMNISGSTIEYTEKDFPIKNIPIGKIKLETESDIEAIEQNINTVKKYFCEEIKTPETEGCEIEETEIEESETEELQIAIAMKGIRCPSFLQVQRMAEKIMDTFDRLFQSQEEKLILIIEADIGKALGQALKHRNVSGRSIICIDNISCNSGDYIDLGQPIAEGTVIPVVVKTLVFQNKEA